MPSAMSGENIYYVCHTHSVVCVCGGGEGVCVCVCVCVCNIHILIICMYDIVTIECIIVII